MKSVKTSIKEMKEIIQHSNEFYSELYELKLEMENYFIKTINTCAKKFSNFLIKNKCGKYQKIQVISPTFKVELLTLPNNDDCEIIKRKENENFRISFSLDTNFILINSIGKEGEIESVKIKFISEGEKNE